MALPQWATPERLEYLVALFENSGGFCVYGHKPCPHPEHHYEIYIDGYDVTVNEVEYAHSYEQRIGEHPKTGKLGLWWFPSETPVMVAKKHHINGLIDDWKEDDRQAKAEQLRMENRVLADMAGSRGWGRRFDPVAREQFFDKQPEYYLEGLGISGLTFKPIAKVRVPSTMQHLFVDVPRQKMSKNQRRKARRYHRQAVHDNCDLAVKDFKENR